MTPRTTRRRLLLGSLQALAGSSLLAVGEPVWALQKTRDPKIDSAVEKGLQYLAREQRRQGYWEANGGQYRVAMTALSGAAMLCEGSTTTRGKYAEQIARAVDYLLDQSQPSGLIGFQNDYHYTYGHGFSMLFLSQVFGEEDDAERRRRIKEVLGNAVTFSIQAQTTRGGWGYVSAKDGNDFDEGSTCVTQVQGLRACRNAGIVVPKEPIDAAKEYIRQCTTPEGGVQYSIRGGGARPPITAAAVAAMYNAGEYDASDHVKLMLDFCKANVWPGGGVNQAQMFGHWHYTHYYYAQVMYRQPADWPKYFADISRELIVTQQGDGSWGGGHVGPVYTTAINCTILQIDKGFLPVYQR
jgi:hypothetical protein